MSQTAGGGTTMRSPLGVQDAGWRKSEKIFGGPGSNGPGQNDFLCP